MRYTDRTVSTFDFNGLLCEVEYRKIVIELLYKYKKHLSTQIETLKKLIQKDDYIKNHRIAHSIRGGASILQAVDLIKAARGLEDAAKDKRKNEIPWLYTVLRRKSKQIQKEIKKGNFYD